MTPTERDALDLLTHYKAAAIAVNFTYTNLKQQVQRESLVFYRVLMPGGYVYQCIDGDMEYRMWYADGRWEINTYEYQRETHGETAEEAIRYLLANEWGVLGQDSRGVVSELNESQTEKCRKEFHD